FWTWMVNNVVLSPDIRPDSRARDEKGAIWVDSKWLVPIYCMSCGDPAGYSLPKETCTFVGWLCNDCVETYGLMAGMWLMPDEVFWEEMAGELQHSQEKSHALALDQERSKE